MGRSLRRPGPSKEFGAEDIPTPPTLIGSIGARSCEFLEDLHRAFQDRDFDYLVSDRLL